MKKQKGKDYFDIPALSASLLGKMEWALNAIPNVNAEFLLSLDSGGPATESTMYGDAFHKMMERWDLGNIDHVLSNEAFYVLKEEPSKALLTVIESKPSMRSKAYVNSYKNKTIESGDKDAIDEAVQKILDSQPEWCKAKQEGLTVITPSQEVLLKETAKKLKQNAKFRKLMGAVDIQEVWTEQVITSCVQTFVQIKPLCYTPLRTKVMLDRIMRAKDVFGDEYIIIIDWKTTSKLNEFEKSYADTYQYWRQFGMYYMMAKAYFTRNIVNSEDMPKFLFYTVAVSSSNGDCRVIEISENDLNCGWEGGFRNPFNIYLNNQFQLECFMNERQQEALKFMGFPIIPLRREGAYDIIKHVDLILKGEGKYYYTNNERNDRPESTTDSESEPSEPRFEMGDI